MLTAVATLSGIGTFAQGNDTAGINEATQMVNSYFDPATELIQDIALRTEEVHIGYKRLSLQTLSDTDDLLGTV